MNGGGGMEFTEARESVIMAGKKLVEAGLIARTWGNVSCRVDADRFAITPSGRAYETLTPGDIVIVTVTGLRYDGPIKPSSEKGVHADVYRLKPEAGFVIHTHQTNASVAAALGKPVDVADAEARRLVGERVELAAYGLPGTGKLRKGVSEALKRTHGRAVLMARHGALCFGAGPAEAFAAALALEEACAGYVTEEKPGEPEARLFGSRRKGNAFVLSSGEREYTIDLPAGMPAGGGSAPPEAALHRAVYLSRPDTNVIRWCMRPAVVAASRRGCAVRPLLDDFAQLIGLSARCARWDAGDTQAGARRCARALKGRNAVLVEGCGALCCAGSDGDASAVEQVLDKGCKAALAARERGGARPIAPAECALMRFVYLRKYSKLEKLNRNEPG